MDLSYVVEKCLATPVAGEKIVNLNWLIVGQGNASLATIQSIVIDEIAKQTPAIMQEIVSNVIERLKTERVIPVGGTQPLESVNSGGASEQPAPTEGRVSQPIDLMDNRGFVRFSRASSLCNLDEFAICL